MPVSTDYLYQVTNPVSGVTTTLLPLDGELDLTFNRKNSVFHVDFSDGGLDSFGATSPFDLEVRTIQVKFTVVYNTTYPNSTVARDTMIKSFGHGLTQWLTFAMADGTFRYARARPINNGFHVTMETRAFAVFEVMFVLTDPYLTDLVPIGGLPKWDDPTLSWDQVGIAWDHNTNTWAMTGGVAPTFLSAPIYYQQRTLNVVGNAPTRDILVQVWGPMSGPITLYNTAIVYNGMPMYISFSGNLATSNDTVAFNILGDSITTGGPNASAIDAYSVMSYGYPYGQDEWFRLEPGNNVLQLNCSNATVPNGTWSVIYTPKYL